MMQATQDLNVATSVPNYLQRILKNVCLQLEWFCAFSRDDAFWLFGVNSDALKF